jgi:hypothetical protein
MKRRYFSMFEKIRIFYYNYYYSFCIIFGAICIVNGSITAVVMLKGTIALYNSNNYVYGTDINIKKRSHNSSEYNHTIAYIVNGKSYEVTVINSSADTIRERIKIVYLAHDPAVATASEITMSFISAGILALGIFPLVGLAFFIYGLRGALQNLYVLENGEIALGKFLHSEKTMIRINRKRVMKLYFSFTDKDGKEQQTSAKTRYTHKLLDEPLKMLVYMPNDVKKSVFLDTMPSFVRKKLYHEFEKLKK